MWIIVAFGLIVYDNFRNGAAEYDDSKKLKRFRQKFERGTISENMLVKELQILGFNPGAIFHDLYLSNSTGTYTQIDLVLATKVGIVVFEVKDYTGWIFGQAADEYWTQTHFSQQRYKFYNPIKQNKTHVDNLKRRLFFEKSVPFFSVIIFYGDCEIRTEFVLPPQTYLIYKEDLEELLNQIITGNPLAEYTDKKAVIRILQEAVKNGSDDSIVERHISTVKSITGS